MGPAATPTGSVPVVLRSVLVPTPKLAPLTRRVNDEGLRARIVHAPEAANDKARVLAEGFLQVSGYLDIAKPSIVRT